MCTSVITVHKYLNTSIHQYLNTSIHWDEAIKLVVFDKPLIGCYQPRSKQKGKMRVYQTWLIGRNKQCPRSAGFRYLRCLPVISRYIRVISLSSCSALVDFKQRSLWDFFGAVLSWLGGISFFREDFLRGLHIRFVVFLHYRHSMRWNFKNYLLFVALCLIWSWK